MFARLRGRGAATPEAALANDLKRVTESNVIEVPPALMGAIVEASQKGEEERRTIMLHLRQCLSEPTCKRWKRIYAGMLLLEELLRAGAQDLVLETAEGRHFDLVQRLSLLEVFQDTNDKRVQNMVRTKASALRAEVVPRLETASESAGTGVIEKSTELAVASNSTAELGKEGSPDSLSGGPLTSVDSFSTSASSFGGNDFAYTRSSCKPEGQIILNGVVTVGHSDDTTSESSGAEDATARAAVAYRQRTRKSTRERDRRRSTEAEDAGKHSGVPDRSPPPPSQCVDLLNL